MSSNSQDSSYILVVFAVVILAVIIIVEWQILNSNYNSERSLLLSMDLVFFAAFISCIVAFIQCNMAKKFSKINPEILEGIENLNSTMTAIHEILKDINNSEETEAIDINPIVGNLENNNLEGK